MTEITDTNLWATTLGKSVEDKTPGERDARERLRAAEIPRDLPDYTVHDISHLDAPWEMAGLIAGSDYPLTASEAFVLGGAFLVHDLGMSLAAYPEGMEALRKEGGWGDTVSALWHP
jgi:hypothetical protein